MYTVTEFKNIRMKKRNKYNANKKEFDGVYYHSAKEAAFAQDLAWRLEAGDIKEWKRQVKIPLDVYGVHICNYYIDFVITHNDDSIEYIEVKGFETQLWQMKWKLFEAIFQKHHPGAILTIVK